jgi:predicted Holliday junction resolvase-like endonuclease
MEDIVVTWGDLIKIVLVLLGTGVLFYLLLAVANLVGILKNIKKVLDKNSSHISGTLEKLPGIAENVEKATGIVKDEMESIQKVMGNISKISDSAKDAAEIIKKDIIVKAKNILDIIDWIKSLFQEKGGKNKEIVYKYKYKPAKETVEEEVLEPEEHEKTKTGDKKTKQEKNNNPTVNDNKADAECE